MAKKEHRPVKIIPFDTHVERVFSFCTKHDHTETEYNTFMRYRHGGGTDFDAPIRHALDAIREETTYKKADIVFLTDGHSSVSESYMEAFQKEKKNLEVSMFTIYIHNAEENKDLNQISDRSFKLNSTQGGQVERDIIEEIFDSI